MQIIDLFFPRKCFGCKKKGIYLCRLCSNSFEIRKSSCSVCNRPAIDGLTHAKCSKPHGIDALITLWKYDGVLRKLLLALKYKFARSTAEDLAFVFVSTLRSEKLPIPNKALFIPIPLHWYRQNWRGFNQVVEMGRLVCEGLGGTFGESILIRKQLKAPQAGLSRDRRLRNIQGVFALNPKVDRKKLKGVSVILFDDVYTTGSTMKEAAKVLKRAGVTKVWGMTVAR